MEGLDLEKKVYRKSIQLASVAIYKYFTPILRPKPFTGMKEQSKETTNPFVHKINKHIFL